MRIITTVVVVFMSLGAFAQNSIGFSLGFEKNHLSNVNPNSLSPDGGSGKQSN